MLLLTEFKESAKKKLLPKLKSFKFTNSFWNKKITSKNKKHPKINANGNNDVESADNSDNLMFNIIITNKSKTAIAPT